MDFVLMMKILCSVMKMMQASEKALINATLAWKYFTPPPPHYMNMPLQCTAIKDIFQIKLCSRS